MKKYIKKNISLDELESRIKIAQDYVLKTKRTYEEALKQLKDLLDKKDEIQSERLLKAFFKSGRTYDEVMTFLKNDISK